MGLVLSFNSPVLVRRILVIGGGESNDMGEEELAAHPSRLCCFVNRGEEFDFSSVNDLEATQEFNLAVNAHDSTGLLTRISAFTNVTTLALYFPANHGGSPSTLLRYIGLQGEHTHHKREAVLTKYEKLCPGHSLGYGPPLTGP